MEYNTGGHLHRARMSGSHRGNDQPVTWDTEEDHLLSYFLEEASGLNQETQQSRNSVRHGNLSVARNSSFRQSNTHRTPNTPAVHFYPSTGSNDNKSSPVPVSMPVESSSSSSSSLDAMAATLVSGGPVLQQQPQQSMYPYALSPTSGISPISPAATMGTPQEMLMLPPEHTPTTAEERQKHLAWVNQVKSRALVPSMYGPLVPSNPNVQAAASSTYASQPSRETESQERRARRLARNRESARQSRRRKKERLASLSCQVNKLHSQLEQERRRLFEELEPELQALRRKTIDALENEEDDARRLELIRDTFAQFGPNCLLRKEAISYQYAALEKFMLPKHQIFILWLTLQGGGFFTAGKEERAKTEGANNRISSKQIGEELTNEWKGNAGGSTKGNGKRNKQKASKSSAEMVDESGMSTLTARSNEPHRLWPLFSYDMSISVDQEERLIQFHQQSQEMNTLPDNRREMSDAMKLIQNMKRGILSQCQATVGRNERLLVDILEPDQSANFLKWCQRNGSRYQNQSITKQHHDEGSDISCENSISDVCQRIKQIMIIPEETGTEVDEQRIHPVQA
mmetsp:Transcript_4170/g.5981  ORF Transcript_4170/g.5981 Transcript_4170/m.5981 type:complete len:572 (+) Transcript_4170:138-1853(+)